MSDTDPLFGYKRAIDAEFRGQLRDSLQTLELPVAERVETGRCIAGLLYMGTDGRRTAHHVFSFHGAAGKYRAGDYAVLNPGEPEPRGPAVPNGLGVVVESVSFDRIVLRTRGRLFEPLVPGLAYVLDESPPSWAPNYQRLAYALAVMQYNFEYADRLSELLDGRMQIESVAPEPSLPDDLSGERAAAAFQMAVTKNFAAIQGPPGTGKTYLLARVARELVSQGKRVVLCCFTHRALNNALRAMLDAGVPAELLAKIPGSDESDLPKQVRTVDRRAYWSEASQPGVTAMTVYAAFDPLWRPLAGAARRATQRQPEREALDEAAFWKLAERHNREVAQTARLPKAGSLADVVLFDEAGQLTVPMALCGLAVAQRAVLFGDHAQLPPVSAPPDDETPPSIFHLAAMHYPDAFVRLNRSYRMNAGLCSFPAREFYDDDLGPADENAGRRLEGVGAGVPAPYRELLGSGEGTSLGLVDHTACGQESPLEAAIAADLALALLQEGEIPSGRGLAVLAAHRRQVNAIREAFQSLARALELPATRVERYLQETVIDTVDRMQGQERDVILYSLTASDHAVLEQERDFLFMPNRFNVALTRARKKLIVLASREFFHHLPHEVLHAPWSGSEGGRARRIIEEANIFKRWYLEHRDTAVNLTSRAEELVVQLGRLT